jgi:hypothetical protein
MFDFYGLPPNWPGKAKVAPTREFPHRRAELVEEAMLGDLAAHAGKHFRAELFIPYVQVHEFEALLFADVAKLAEELAERSGPNQIQLTECFQSVLDEAGGEPETINDGYDTCPSRRIESAVSKCNVPKYKKKRHGPLIAGKIGLEALRAACPHFGQWLGRLESLGADAPAS